MCMCACMGVYVGACVDASVGVCMVMAGSHSGLVDKIYFLNEMNSCKAFALRFSFFTHIPLVKVKVFKSFDAEQQQIL